MPIVRNTRLPVFGLLLASLVTAPAGLQAAVVSVCPAPALVESEAANQFYGREGQLLALTVADAAPADPTCRVIELPVPAAQVSWLSLSDIATTATPPTLTLQGRFDQERAVVSEVIHADAAATEPGYLPLGENLLRQFTAQPFGSDERSSFSAEGQLQCRAGTHVAGITLQTSQRWEQLPGLTLALEVSGQGSIEVAIADAARHASGTPLTLGNASVRSGERSTVSLPLPTNAAPWTTLTLVCPTTDATLTLHGLRLQPPAAREPSSRRATWLWSPASWLDQRAQVWALAEQERLNRLYVTVPTVSETVAQPEALASFISEARQRGIEVWAVVGDRRDVLADSLPALLARAAAYRAYNAAHASAALAGLQLDIEPYLLPGYALAPGFWRQRYLETVLAVHETLAAALALDLVQPVWWGTHADWGSKLLDALVRPGLSITVMNYRTNAPALRAGALPFLAWGQAHGVAVTMALETGSISRDGRSETRRRFVRSNDSGELWLFELDGLRVLALLATPHAGLPGQSYKGAGQSTFDNGNVTLLDAPQRLQALAEQMNAEWSVWPGYAGLAIHGLEETRLLNRN